MYCPGDGQMYPCPNGSSTGPGQSSVDGCTICPLGTYTPSSGSTCQSCPAGSYCFSGFAVPCPVGTWSTSSSSSSTVSSCRTHLCPTGYQCQGGTQTLCQPGTYRSSSMSVCAPCPAGQYSPGSGYGSCSSCPRGSYCNGDGVLYPCPPGSYNPNTGAQSVRDCLSFLLSGYYLADPSQLTVPGLTSVPSNPGCPGGSFCPGDGMRYSCPAGSYQPSSCSSSCILCPAGTYNPWMQINNVASCVSCPPGSFSTSGSSICSPCGLGTFSGWGQAVCTPCPPGTYTNATGQTASTACTWCPSGFVCPGDGTRLPCPAGTYSSSATCTPCPLGTFNALSAQNNISACTLCPAGTFGSAPGQMSPSSCQYCPAGTFAAGNGSIRCDLCPAGTYTASIGQSSCQICATKVVTGSSSCDMIGVSCAAGTFFNLTSSKCDLCPTGTFSIAIGAIGSCTSCPPGTFVVSNTTGWSSRSVCGVCPAGTYSEASSSTVCIRCPPGSYSESEGSASAERCTSCPQGTSSNLTGSNSSSSCVACAAGTFSLAGAASCTPLASGSYSASSRWGSPIGVYCPAGTFGPLSGATSAADCLPCPAGTFSAAMGATSNATCIPCPAGSYNSLPASTALSSCVMCTIGTFSAATGANTADACRPCSPGTFSATVGSTACQSIPAGYYSNRSGLFFALGGTPCPQGTYGPTSGATDFAQCLQCPSGTFGAFAAASSVDMCVTCPQGTYRSEPGASRADQCLACSLGTFANGTGSSACELCPRGTYGPASAASSIAQCLACDVGTYAAEEGAVACTPCNAGMFQNQTGQVRCEPCVAGTSTDDSMGNSDCTPCTHGQFSNHSGASSCTLCATGTYQPDEGATGCLQCDSGLVAMPLPLDDSNRVLTIEGCHALQHTIPINYGAVGDAMRTLSPTVTVTSSDGGAYPSFLSIVVSKASYILISAVEIPLIGLDAAAQGGVDQTWTVSLLVTVSHLCRSVPWTATVQLVITQTPPRFAAPSTTGMYACPQYETSFLASLGSCAQHVTLSAAVTNIVWDDAFPASIPRELVAFDVAPVGGLVSVFGSAPSSGVVKQFSVVGVALLGTTNVSSLPVVVTVTMAQNNRPTILASVYDVTACPFVEVRFSGTPAICGKTKFSVQLINGSLLPSFFQTYSDAVSVVVSGVVPLLPPPASLTIVGTAIVAGGGASLSTQTAPVVVRRSSLVATASVFLQWQMASGVWGAASDGAGNATVASATVRWHSVTIYYGLPLSIDALLGGVDAACASIGLWTAGAPPTSTSTVPSAAVPDWVRVISESSGVGGAVTKLQLTGTPPNTLAEGSVVTMCIFALDGANNPAMCFEATVAMSLIVTTISIIENVTSSSLDGTPTNNTTANATITAAVQRTSFVILTPSTMVTTKMSLPVWLPFPALLICPSGGTALAFCQYDSSTRTLGAFGTATGIATLLSNVLIATSRSDAVDEMQLYNATVSVSDSVNPSPAVTSVSLALLIAYEGVRLAVPLILPVKVGIPSQLSLLSFLGRGTTSADVQFSLLYVNDTAAAGSSMWSVVGTYFSGTATMPPRNVTVVLSLSDTHTTLTQNVSGIVQVMEPASPNATVTALPRQVMTSSSTVVVAVPGGVFTNPEGGPVAYSARYTGPTPPDTSFQGAPLPAWATFDSMAMQLSLQPTSDSVGDHFFVVSVVTSWGEWSGNASTTLHVTVDYSVRDLLLSFYAALGYVITVFSFLALIYAYRADIRNTLWYRWVQSPETAHTLLRLYGEVDVASPSAPLVYPSLSLSSTARPIPMSKIGTVRVVTLRREPQTSTTTSSWLRNCVPFYWQCRLVHLDNHLLELTHPRGDCVEGAPWLRLVTRCAESDDDVVVDIVINRRRLRSCLTSGMIRNEDLLIVEVLSAGWWSQNFVLVTIVLAAESFVSSMQTVEMLKAKKRPQLLKEVAEDSSISSDDYDDDEDDGEIGGHWSEVRKLSRDVRQLQRAVAASTDCFGAPVRFVEQQLGEKPVPVPMARDDTLVSQLLFDSDSVSVSDVFVFNDGNDDDHDVYDGSLNSSSFNPLLSL